MVHIHEYLKKESLEHDVHMMLQVHDELVFEIHDEKVKKLVPILKSLMEDVLKSEEMHGVPLCAEVKVGANWDEMKAYQV
jgi:DNA polymerase-1